MKASEYNRHLPGPGAYTRSWRELIEIVKDDPETPVMVPGWLVGLPGWGMMSRPAQEVLRRVRDALDNRINARGAGIEPGDTIYGT